jgi:hypothetical protein
MILSGIEPATCRFVALCLNHYTTARPLLMVLHDIQKDDNSIFKKNKES